MNTSDKPTAEVQPLAKLIDLLSTLPIIRLTATGQPAGRDTPDSFLLSFTR